MTVLMRGEERAGERKPSVEKTKEMGGTVKERTLRSG